LVQNDEITLSKSMQAEYSKDLGGHRFRSKKISERWWVEDPV